MSKKKMKQQKNVICVFKFPIIVRPLTRAGDDSEHIFVQAGVQKGAGSGGCHQSVGKQQIFSSILRKNNSMMDTDPHTIQGM